MKKTVKAMLTVMLAASLILILGACGKSNTIEVRGKLTNAVDKEITVKTVDGPEVFKTADDTVYNLGEASELTVGDTVRVRYHKSFGKDHVDEVTVLEHFEPELNFVGKVAGIKDGTVTVTGKSLTVAFTRDDDTAVRGELKVGAEVEISYDGDLSEYPYATDIKVTKKAIDGEEKSEEKKEESKDSEQKSEEKKEEVKTATVSGIVSEFTEKSVLLAIDSATSYRFTLAKDVKVTGADKYVHTGDSVNIKFTGKLGKSPEAVEINIVKKAQEEKKTVNGKITSIEKDYLTLNTGKKSYIIHTDKNTKYTGDKPAKGYKAEITYTGNLSRDAMATNVYCVKVSPDKKVIFTVTFTDGTGNIISTQTVEKGKAAKAPKNPAREGYIFKGWDKDFSKVTSDLTVSAVWKKVEPKPEPEKEISAEGTITKWTEDGENYFDLQLKDGTTINLEVGDFTKIASGYFPAVDDKVKVTYLESDMTAKEIVLIEKAGQGDDDKDDSGDEPAPEPDDESVETEPTPAPDETVEPEEETVEPEPAKEEETVEPEPAKEEEVAEPEPAKEEEAAEPEPEPEKEEAAEPEPEPEPEPKEEPDVVVSAGGTIVEGNEKKQTVTILSQDGEKITLKMDGDTKIASGYFPEKDDVVEIKYTKKAMVLKSIKLIDRPEPPAPEEAEEEGQE